MPNSEPIEIIPKGEDDMHRRGQWCPCSPIVEPGESISIAHQSLTPGDNCEAVRRDG